MRISVLLTFLFFTQTAFANWQLDNDNSTLSFITTKKQHVAENHTFKKLSGSIDDKGRVNFVIDLTSVNTNIGIRDTRMQEHLFQVKKYATATFSNQIDMAVINKLATGKNTTTKMAGLIDLHGQQQLVNFEVMIAKLNAEQVLITSLAPVLIKAKDFKLVSGINKLKELAGLPSISYTVPVSFTLTFKK